MFKFLREKIAEIFKKDAAKSEEKKKIVASKISEKKNPRKKKEPKSDAGQIRSERAEKKPIIAEFAEKGAEKDSGEIKEDGFFRKLARKISNSELKREDFEELFMEFELTLLENNVALEVVDRIKETLVRELVGKKFLKGESEGKIFEALKKSIDEILIEPEDILEKIKNKQGVFVILFFGINGGGKTTSIAKLAYFLEKKGINCVLAAADTFRAASIEQLNEHAQRIGVPLVKHDYMSDPASVGYDAIQFAKKNHKKVVLIDTAGRMYTRINLMKEMEKIVRVTNPDLKIFVGESITGNDGTEQAKMFNETAGIDGIILSKADVDEKAGTILSVSYVTGKPIYFLGVGQGYEDLEIFSKKSVFKGLGLE